MMHAKYLFRPFTKRMAPPTLFRWLERSVPSLMAVSRALGSVPLIGRALKRVIPVADYTGRYPLTDQQLREWALLDTFDMLAPTYDNPQSATTVRQWFEQEKLTDIEVGHWGHLVGRGIKPV
jgi:hypothetical protein